MTFPACFESQSQYDAWREAANVCRPRHGYCEDCTPEYQSRMLWESRCKYPRTEFVFHTARATAYTPEQVELVGHRHREDRS